MIGLAGERRAVAEQEVGGNGLKIRADDDPVVGADARLGIGIIADEQDAPGREERPPKAFERDIGLRLDFGAVELGRGGIGEADA